MNLKLDLKSTCYPSANTKPRDVGCLKQALNFLGYYKPPQDIGMTNIPDQGMFDALKNFQKDHDLKINGRVAPGDDTENAINHALSDIPHDAVYKWCTVRDGKVRSSHAARGRLASKSRPLVSSTYSAVNMLKFLV